MSEIRFMSEAEYLEFLNSLSLEELLLSCAEQGAGVVICDGKIVGEQ